MDSPRWRERIARQLLNDPRDVPLMSLAARATLLLPAALSVWLAPPRFRVAASALYLLVYFVHLERFITMFHDVNHRPLFRRRFRILNRFVAGVLGPLYGSTPNTYHAHHVLMHHPANNLEHDVSTTLPYRRDSIRDFLRYYVRFFFSLFALRSFLRARYPNRPTPSRLLMTGELGFWAIAGAAAWVDPWAALLVFVFPVVVTRTVLIIGNWGEHAFVDPREPGNLFRNSTNLLGRINERDFNVGYHICHHLRPAAHFSTHPAWFEANRERYGREDAIVLRDMHYPDLWLLLMMKRYTTLADRYVHLPGAPVRTREEIVTLLKARVEPVSHSGEQV